MSKDQFRKIAPFIIIFLWPFVFFFRYIIADQPFSLLIGNDFVDISYGYKVYLLDKLSNLDFPLWSPSEASGYPFYSNPFTQCFYPLNIPLALFYKIFNGYSYVDHQRFAVLGVSIYLLGLYLWLRSLNLDKKSVFFSTIIIGVSYKVSETLRFPVAVHTLSWMPWVLLGLTICVSKQRRIKGAIIITFSTILLITGGYPYYFFYSIFLFVPYIFFCLFFFKEPKSPFVSIWAKVNYIITISISFTLSILVCLPYLLKIKGLMEQTSGRLTKDLAFSTAEGFGPLDTISSFIFPPTAQAEGWFYFGIGAVLLIVIYLIHVFFLAHDRDEQILTYGIILWFLLISYLTYGSSSYIFRLFWEYFPGFSRLRMWGRMNIIFIPAIALLFSKAFFHYEGYITRRHNTAILQNRHIYFICLITLSFYLIVYFIQSYMDQNEMFHNYWIHYFKTYSIDETFHIKIGAASIALIISSLLICVNMLRIPKSLSLIFMTLLIFINIYDIWKIGSMQWSYPYNNIKPTISHFLERKVYDINRANMESFRVPRTNYYQTVQLSSAFNVGYIKQWHYQRFTKFYESKLKENPWFTILLGGSGMKVFYSKKIHYNLIRDFIVDAQEMISNYLISSELVFYDGDKLVMIMKTSKSGYISFIDNWDNDWKCKIDGKDVKIEKLFGTFKSVPIGSGESNIEFSYEPKLF